MQAVKNGIKTTLRTPGKALVFTLVMTVLSALLTVAFSVFSAVRGYLGDADGYFHTVAELEFIGEKYPTDIEFEQGLPAALSENEAALSQLFSHDAVLSFTPASNSAALAEGYTRRDEGVPKGKAAVCAMYIINYDEHLGMYSALVSKCFYSLQKYDDKLVHLSIPPVAGELEPGKKYAMCGYFTKGFGGIAGFIQENMRFSVGGKTYNTDFCEPLESNELPEGSVFKLLATQLELVNNACRVTRTEAIEDELPFHQQQLMLKSGRFFSKNEYEEAARVVILSDKLCYGAGKKKVGDRINLRIFDFEGSLEDAAITGMSEDEYEIVGVFADDSIYVNRIFIPGSPGEGLRAVTGSSLGLFRLKNDRAAAFLTESAGLEEAGFRVSVYDQGYAAATEPMRELELIAIIFLAVCVLLAAVALILQSHIFVSRQGEAARTMRSLGASKSHIILYFLASALLIALIGAIIGSFMARGIEGRVFDMLRRFAEQFSKSDTRFSSSRVSLVRTLEFAPKTANITYISAALCLIAGAAASTLAFALSALSGGQNAVRKRGGAAGGGADAQKAQKGARAAVYRGKTSRLSGALKYALLSLRRNKVRTAAVLLLAAAAAVFFSRLTASLEGYALQLENYKRDAVIKGHATDMYGRRTDGLLTEMTPIKALVDSGKIRDVNLTMDLGYLSVLGIAITKDGVENREISYTYPDTEMMKETVQMDLRRDLKWVSTSSVSGSPAFFFRSVKDVRFLEGYNEVSFMRLHNACALSESVMKQHGIELGDAVMFQGMHPTDDGWWTGLIIMKVIAAYTSNATNKTVFSPLGDSYPIAYNVMEPNNLDPIFKFYYNAESLPQDSDFTDVPDERISWRLDAYASRDYEFSGELPEGLSIEDFERIEVVFPEVKFSSFLFSLKAANGLDEARQAMEDAGFAYVGTYERTKPYAVLEDEMYLNTTRSMQRQIQYVSALYYSLYAIAGLIGFALAWLLALSRRGEMALMRALGTPKVRIVLNFFFEHSLLCLAGLLIGLILTCFAFGMPLSLCLILCGAFLALWCISTLICLVFGLAKKMQTAERE